MASNSAAEETQLMAEQEMTKDRMMVSQYQIEGVKKDLSSDHRTVTAMIRSPNHIRREAVSPEQIIDNIKAVSPDHITDNIKVVLPDQITDNIKVVSPDPIIDSIKVVSPDKIIEEIKIMSPDNIIEEIGGCGRYQIRMSVVIHLIKTVLCFSFTSLIVITSTPTWRCVDNIGHLNMAPDAESSDCFKLKCTTRSCETGNSSKCDTYIFDDSFKTVVSEFKLVCEKDFIPSTLGSLQLAGSLAGSVISGQTADLFGRKPPFFTSIVLVLVFNLIGFFSSTWEMFAVSTFFTGLGYGFFMATQYNILSEFTLAKWRAWIVGFPSWAIQQSLFALCAWLIQDWRYLQLLTALMALPCLMAWLIIPESFRWYLAHNKPKKAKRIIRTVAKYNGHHEDVCVDDILQRHKETRRQRYTFVNLFKSIAMAKLTLLLMLNWIALGVVGFGISFGIQTLSGNIFLNLFLFSITSIPSKVFASLLSNRIGRRRTSILCFIVVAIAGCGVGMLHTLDVRHKGQLTNVLAIIANTSISAAWATVQMMTVELYPTVIRTIGFGTLSFIGGMAAVIGPQLVYFNNFFPGLLFYVCGMTSLMCVVSTFFLPETKDGYLEDIIR